MNCKLKDHKKITWRQKLIISVIKEYWAKHHCSPSLADIAQAVGITKSGAWYHVVKLETLEYITRMPGVARTIVVNEAEE